MKPLKKTDQNKAWNKRKKAELDPINVIEKMPLFLIVCEGQNTEVDYFRAFPVSSPTQIKVVGIGRSKTFVVNHAIDLAKKYKDCQVWCVFDFDIKLDQVGQKEDYHEAIRLAEQQGFQIAYSNDSFELWFILHYQTVQSRLTRKEYYAILSKLWDCDYEKSGKERAFSNQIYKKLQEDKEADQQKAIERAEKLWKTQENEKPADQNPCTKVFALVRELNQYLRK